MPLFGSGENLVPLIVGGIVAVIIIFVAIYASRYVKAGPNQVLVISGRRRSMLTADGRKESVGFRIRVGGGAFVWPVFERVDMLSLELMTLEAVSYTHLTLPTILLV